MLGKGCARDSEYVAMKWRSRLLHFREKSPGHSDHPNPLVLVTQNDSSATSEGRGIPVHDGQTNSSAEQASRGIVIDQLDVQNRRLSGRQQKPWASNPLGLTVLHIPDGQPIADIIFVHGLGGTSQHTWSKNKASPLFWPKNWLPLEPDIQNARILTFGYNANFLLPGSFASISDFAKSLLFNMKFGRDEDVKNLGIGKRPIIFVTHSMGGLVFKKAYLQAVENDEYKDIISQVQAIIFLSTPHRGTNLADFLNSILSVSIFNHSPKQYISDLVSNSPAIEDINERFRWHAAKLRIFSFYETLETSIGPRRMVIVQKDSSSTGLEGEVSIPLNANHHDVCKFESRDDPNYKSVRSVLATLISTVHNADERRIFSPSSPLTHSPISNNKAEDKNAMGRLSQLLSTCGAPNDDLTHQVNLWRPGTCKSFMLTSIIVEWMSPVANSGIVWLHGQPACGKSVKAAYITNHMIDACLSCSYYFFVGGDSTRMSIVSLLRSLAFQTAQQVPAFKDFLLELSEKRIALDKMDTRLLWERLFVGGLFQMQLQHPLYWIIDALDESESAGLFLGIMSSISQSAVPIRILVASRETPEISTGFNRISHAIPVAMLSAEDNIDDLRIYTTQEVDLMFGNVELRQHVVDQILTRSAGNFLWAHFALEEIRHCNSQEDIEMVLSALPRGMEAKYQRMEARIASLSRESDVSLAQAILSWATFSRRILTREELVYALQYRLEHAIDLKRTINNLSGEFLLLDDNDRLCFVHPTAREYLMRKAHLPFSFKSSEMHKQLCHKSIEVFLDPQIRSKLRKPSLPPFYFYAATSWPFHLSQVIVSSDSTTSLLRKFFETNGVSSWMQILATMGELNVLAYASNALILFLKDLRQRSLITIDRPYGEECVELLDQWAFDLLKLGGKFGSHLIEDPTVIYKYVPQFCPEKSILYRRFRDHNQVSVMGLPDADWDDQVTRLSVGAGQQATRVKSAGQYLAVSSYSGNILIWDCVTYEEIHKLDHGEYIRSICFSSNGELMASYGVKTTKFWNIRSGFQTHVIDNLPDTRALSMALTKGEGDTILRVATDIGKIVEVSLSGNMDDWRTIYTPMFQENPSLQGFYTNCPTSMEFSKNMEYVVMAYRNLPLSVWEISTQLIINRCVRRAGPGESLNTWNGATKVIWHPNNDDVLGIYTDGIVFKWNPFEDIYRELREDVSHVPSEIECCPSGAVFATSDATGYLRIYTYDKFSLIYMVHLAGSITGVCFSLDSRCLYTLRDSDCDVWEPAPLMRISESEERQEGGSNYKDISGVTSVDSMQQNASLTAIGPRPQGILFCISNDAGSAEIRFLSGSEVIPVGNSLLDLEIDLFSWSQDGIHFAFSNHDIILVMKAVISTKDVRKPWADFQMERVAAIPINDGYIYQILVSPDARFLLVSGACEIKLWTTSSGNLRGVPSCVLEKATLYDPQNPQALQVWVENPAQKENILAFTLDEVKAYTWNRLQEVARWQINGQSNYPDVLRVLGESTRQRALPRHSEVTVAVKEFLDEVIISQDSKYALMLISETDGRQKRWSRLQILELSALQNSQTAGLKPLVIPTEIEMMMVRPFGVLQGDRLVFLDKSYWIRTWRLGSTSSSGNLTRHFFLPRDWVSLEVLKLCKLLNDGTFLCPRKGNVVIIRSSLGRDW